MSQNQQIRQALERGEVLTPLDALQQFGCFRLSERCREIENDPVNPLVLEHEWLTLPNSKRVMSYRLLKVAYG